MPSPSPQKRTVPSFWRVCASQLATVSLFTLAIPIRPATAAISEFQVCAAELLRADVSRDLAAAACAEVLYPKDLSLCVLKIKTLTPIGANDALVACTRVRRPKELAKCVVDIDDNIENADSLSVLDHCRRTLLPLRFAECVVGLSREIDFSPPRALETCIDAEDFPR
ncbi:hypothetical protein IQ257_13425 [Coleofasciculus sp. LEGE 07092]|nr:hypothetical protein [Coleofasciculus sp. LEGE 07092]